MRRLLAPLLLLALAVVATPARAFTPQTITVDGVNDFLPGNLLNDDSFDTQSACGAGIYPIEIVIPLVGAETWTKFKAEFT